MRVEGPSRLSAFALLGRNTLEIDRKEGDIILLVWSGDFLGPACNAVEHGVGEPSCRESMALFHHPFEAVHAELLSR